MTSYLSIAVFAVYILCALIRLAYFNVTEEIRQNENTKRQTYDGLPVTSAAIILPLFYSLKIFFPERFFWLYGALLFAIAVCFISPFKLKKPGKLASALILIIGVIEFALLIIQTLF
jgi:CDP-diacylglycerol--serine O-phosphatidyltransferase